jgi:hypothetical protein
MAENAIGAKGSIVNRKNSKQKCQSQSLGASIIEPVLFATFLLFDPASPNSRGSFLNSADATTHG